MRQSITEVGVFSFLFCAMGVAACSGLPSAPSLPTPPNGTSLTSNVPGVDGGAAVPGVPLKPPGK